jgi:hypothetical protein
VGLTTFEANLKYPTHSLLLGLVLDCPSLAIERAIMRLTYLLCSIVLVVSSNGEFTPPQPLATIFSSTAGCIFTYSECMQDLAICWRTQRFLDLTICDLFQDRCEQIYSKCRSVEIPVHSLPYQETETERCMAEYDKCLDRQSDCHNTSFQMTYTADSPDLNNKCVDIGKECGTILQSCHNPGSIEKARPTETSELIYKPTWTAPETILEPTPSFLQTPATLNCLTTYHHCITFHTTCQEDVASYESSNQAFDAKHRAKACYQIFLRCKAHASSCAAHPPGPSSTPIPTWIPDRTAQGVEIPPWVPSIDKTEGNEQCIAGYQRCLILYRNCLMTATLMQESGWFERAELHRNECEKQLIPLCKSGLEVCATLKML